MTNRQMIQDFIEQTGITDDRVEYANPSRSRVDTMFYTGNDPWHRIGKKLDNPATAAEAIEAAGLNWEVDVETVHLSDGTDTKKFATVRHDNKDIFAVGLTSRYKPLQNIDAFKFFDGVVGDGQAIYHTAGSLNGGRIVWILAKLDGQLVLESGGDTDLADKYIMLSNSHDGTRGVDMRFVVKRVVCMNTFRLAFSDGANNLSAKYRHTNNIMNRIVQTRELLGLSDVYYANFMKQAEALIDTNDFNSDYYFSSVLGLDLDDAEEMASLRSRPYYDIKSLYDGQGYGSDLKTASRTLYGAFNAVSQYVEHDKPIKGGIIDADEIINKRLSSSFFGRGAVLEQNAWKQAVRMAAI